MEKRVYPFQISKQLDEKLARWAGFEYIPNAESQQLDFWICPTGGRGLASYPPPFTVSLDACFRWLIPLIDAWEMAPIFSEDEIEVWVEKWTRQTVHHGKATDKEAALALCKAIEQLIDAENAE